MGTGVTPTQLRDYIESHYDYNFDSDAYLNNVRYVILFEALSECIVKHNDNADISNLTREFLNSHKDSAEEFAENKFDEFVSESSLQYIPIKCKDEWIEATKQGIMETKRLEN